MVHKIIYEHLNDFLAPEVFDLTKALETRCESPIEVMLGYSLILVDRISPMAISRLWICSQGEEEQSYSPSDRLLIPQYRWEGRRVDFVLREYPFDIFIECDGHNFHERTKEQAARDRRKDRDSQREGKPILRFTG